MNQANDVVITGVGVVSPIGVEKGPFWQSLTSGKSGVKDLELLAGTEMPVRFGAPLADFEPKKYVKPRKSLKVMCNEITAGVSSAAIAMEDAGLAEGAVDPDRFGVVFGADMYYCPPSDMIDAYLSCYIDGEFDFQNWGDRGKQQLYPLWMLKHLPNMIACHIGINFDARGPNNTMVEGEASSLLALIEAMHVIRRGHADMMITGGSGSRLSLTPFMYRTRQVLSRRSADPAAASRPFDADRDGMVNGEGAASLVLESRQHAEARGAAILAEIKGASSRYGEPGEVLQRAISAGLQAALEEAKLTPADVGHVNAHGDSTIEGDQREAQAIAAVLSDVPVTAPKSFFGNLGAGGGAVEMAASVIGLCQGLIPPTLNYSTPDPQCPINVVHGAAQPAEHSSAILLNQSSTGQAVAVVIGKQAE